MRFLDGGWLWALIGVPLLVAAYLWAQRRRGRYAVRFPDLALAAEPEELTWRASTLIRGLTRLPVRLR